MRKFKFLIVGAFILMASSAYAQRDMILTQAGEELRCRIIDETPVRFVFAYLKNGKPYRTEIFKNLVKSFKFDYYDADLPNADKLPEAMYRAIGSTDSQSPRALSTSAKSEPSRRNKKNKKSSAEVDDITSRTSQQEADKKAVALTADTEEGTKLNENQTGQEIKIDRTNRKPTVASQEVGTESGDVIANKPISQPTIDDPLKKKANESAAVVSEKRDDEFSVKRVQEEEAVVESKPNTKTDISETELPNITINQKNRFRVGIKGGIGNRLDNNLQTINSFDLYQEQLLRGYTLGADIAYFPNDFIGFGAVFTDFKSRNSDGEILYRNEFTGAEQIGSVSNNRSVKFVGPALFLRKKLDYKTYVVLGLSPGYNSYVDKGSYESIDYTFTGSGFGAASTLGIDFLLGNDIIGRDIILSFEAGYNYGKITSLDYGDARGVVDLATPIDLSRLDFTIGLRFIRFPKYFRLTSY